MSKTITASRTTPILWPSGRNLPAGWSFAPFSTIAHLSRQKEQVVPEQTYELIGMRWYAKGPYIKEKLLGSAIKASHLYRVATSNFIYNRLFAWKGSFGVINDECAHGYVSGEFPVFTTETSSDSYYLWFLFSQPWAWSMLEDRSAGATSTSRLRLKEDDLAKFMIPLPPVDERNAMVAEVRGQLACVSAARAAAIQQLEAVESLPLALIRRAFNGVH